MGYVQVTMKLCVLLGWISSGWHHRIRLPAAHSGLAWQEIPQSGVFVWLCSVLCTPGHLQLCGSTARWCY